MIDPQLPDHAPVVTAKTLRQFGALWLVLFGGLAYWHGVVQHRTTIGVVLAVFAVGVGLVGLARPEGIRPLFTVLLAVTAPIGAVLSVLLLGVLFYVIFAPLGLIFRAIGRDALHVRRPSRPSHWTPKPRVTDLRSYTRQ